MTLGIDFTIQNGSCWVASLIFCYFGKSSGNIFLLLSPLNICAKNASRLTSDSTETNAATKHRADIFLRLKNDISVSTVTMETKLYEAFPPRLFVRHRKNRIHLHFSHAWQHFVSTLLHVYITARSVHVCMHSKYP